MSKSKKRNEMKEFVVEAEEHIEVLHRSLTEIEKLSDRTRVKAEIVNAIFRAAHTLKGVSGMVGLTKLCELSHAMEDLLDRIRMGKMHFDEPVLESLLEGVDLLQEMVERAGKGKPEKDATPLKERLRHLISEGRGERGESSPVSGGGQPSLSDVGSISELNLEPSLRSVLSEYEEHRILENLRSGARIYRVWTSLSMESFDRDLSSITTRLNTLGEVISTLPVPEGAGEGRIGFNLLVGVQMQGGSLSETFSHPGVEIYEIERMSRYDKLETTETPPAGKDPLPSEADQPVPVSAENEEDSPSGVRGQSQTVRVDIQRLDILLNLVGELHLTKAMVQDISRRLLETESAVGPAQELSKASRVLDKRVTEIQEEIIEIRMIPIGQIFDRMVRAVRKYSKSLGKEINLLLAGEETKMDKSMVEEILDPLMHLIRNAIDHGIETRDVRLAAGKPERGTIWLRASQKGGSVLIEVEDDGGGVNTQKVYEKGVRKGLVSPDKAMTEKEISQLLFLPGFSTRDSVTELSGRGVGLDVVAKNVSRLSGLVDVESRPGKGCRFSITLPITLVIIKALIVRVGGEMFALALNSVSESLMVHPKEIRTVEGREVIQLRNRTLPLLRLDEHFGLRSVGAGGDLVYVIVVGLAEKRLGFVVEAIEGQQEIVIKSIGAVLKEVPGIAGATELGNQKTVLVLDVGSLIDEVGRKET